MCEKMQDELLMIYFCGCDGMRLQQNQLYDTHVNNRKAGNNDLESEIGR